MNPSEVQRLLGSSAQCLGVLTPHDAPPALSQEGILNALLSPVWPDGDRRTIFDIVSPGESVCFVVSDQTRQTAVDRVLPPMLERLYAKGCRAEDMFFLVASGIHRHPKPAELSRILGQAVFDRFDGRVFQHNPDDAGALVPVGRTSRGHEVRINRRAIESDRLILLGTASYHYHAGFGGGRKSLVPGLASRETIAYNHSLTLDPVRDCIRPGVDIGQLDGNPVAGEMLEGAAMCEPDIIVNTVLTPSDELVGLFSGHLDAAHRAACRLAEAVCRVNVARKADFVVASAETAPNWIQSHKALFNSHRVIREGGRIVLLAPCPEGIGDERFRHWVKKPDIRTIYSELRNAPEVLGQTALSTRTRGANTILVTDLSVADRTDLGIRTAPDLATALAMAVKETSTGHGAAPTCYIIPEARHAVPFIVE